jgi:hypothetical protein
MTEPSNKGMKLTTPDGRRGSRHVRRVVIESGVAAYAQCSTDRSFNPPSQEGNGLWVGGGIRSGAPWKGSRVKGHAAP